MLQLIAGQKIGLEELCPEGHIQITVQLALPGGEADIACFGVDSNGQLSDDRYFIFYNQLTSPEGALTKAAQEDVFTLDLSRLPQQIERLVFTAAIDGGAVMSQLTNGYFALQQNGQEIAVCPLAQNMFHQEKAVILCELYRRNGQWRLAVVCKGFDGGLSALLAHFGGEEDATPTQTPPLVPQHKVSLNKSEQVQKVVLEKAPQLIDLTKRAIVSLEKKKLNDLTARVILVLDVSGSMNAQYRKGRVQRLLDKVLPLALLFDDDGTLEVWTYAQYFRRLEDVVLDNIDGFIERANGGWRRWDVGGTNNEPPVMEAIYAAYRDSRQPVYILFISDGGVNKNKEIKRIITEAAHGPLFWQFVGLGGKNYGALEKLDELQGRYIDNANFFALDDIDDLSDEALYDRLLTEFPDWLKLAKEKQIVPNL